MNIKQAFLLFLALLTALILLLSLLRYQSEKNAIPQDEVIETYKNKDLGVQFDYYPDRFGFDTIRYNNGNFKWYSYGSVTLTFYKKISEERQKNLTCSEYLEIHSPTAAELDSRDSDCENIKVHEGFQCEVENIPFVSVEGDLSICRKIKVNGADAVFMLSLDKEYQGSVDQYLYFNLKDRQNGFSDLLFTTMSGFSFEKYPSTTGSTKDFEKLFTDYLNLLENGTSHNGIDLFYKTFKFIE